ncbi:MAG: ATP-grasp domain-containing protein [Desulfobacula sp.]|uniref:ATP-grasp domain-containing protein n=1 Tax=Desulfobacula sp. TaxID=2593537 RepID=UPI002A1494F0|nr:ATP-grasp domain-containing protein [Desulfobacula sp.]MBT5969671.1 ATP-grasp domain-containing protein [Desulfobacula sp.]
MKKKHYALDKVLVVGTTSDYIDWIQTAYPGRALFLTEPEVRKKAKESSPDPADELIIRLENIEFIKKELKKHLEKWNQRITGVACFDCESMETASVIASKFKVSYPDIQAIQNCRDKYISKKIWEESGIRCPAVLPVNSAEEARQFLTKYKNGIVLKPFCGSGSELVFKCKTSEDCDQAFETLKKGLVDREQNRLFNQYTSKNFLMLAEECIIGSEYSCDFIVDNKNVKIIRLSRKIKSDSQPFGTVSGYMLPASLPGQMSISGIETVLLNAAQSLGLKRAICMVDFIVEDHFPVLIEMTPRPGGDCLPFLLKEAGNIDILGLTLDFAEQKTLPVNGYIPFKPHIGLRIHANKAGVFNGLNTNLLVDDKRVKQIRIIRKPGHKIIMPPEDYDSWLLGHIIIEPDNSKYPETQSLLIRQRLKVEIR